MSVDADLPGVDGAENATAPRPIIVIQQRPRRWSAILPPALILLAACGILAFRMGTSDWRGVRLSPFPISSRADASETFGAPDPSGPKAVSGTNFSPRLVTPEGMGSTGSERPAPPKGQAEAVPSPSSVEVRVDPFDPVPGEATPAQPGIASDAPEEGEASLYRPLLATAPRPDELRPPAERGAADDVDAGEVWDDIRDEAQRKRAEREGLEGLKQAIHQQDEQEAARKQADIRESERNRRVDFLRDLRRLVRKNPDAAGPEIRRLADQAPGGGFVSGREVGESSLGLVNSVSRRRAWVARRRHDGVSEPTILAELQTIHMRNVASRNGPRDANQALVRAAIDLLAVPLDAAVPADDPAPVRAAPPPPAPLPARGTPPSSRFGPSRRR